MNRPRSQAVMEWARLDVECFRSVFGFCSLLISLLEEIFAHLFHPRLRSRAVELATVFLAFSLVFALVEGVEEMVTDILVVF